MAKSHPAAFTAVISTKMETVYQEDAYPIPVISVAGLCDIDIDFDGISIIAKLSKENITEFDWNMLGDVRFAVYGAKHSLSEYGNEQTADL